MNITQALARWFFATTVAATCALLGATAHAGVGVTQLPGLQGDGPITVFYPTDAAAARLQRGPFVLQMAADAAPARGNGRLVMVSHGSGGAPWTQAGLATALVEAGFVVALPEHRGDNYRDMSATGPASWKTRPAEISRGIDALAGDARFAALDFGRVGMHGMSAGGHTALSLAGGRWSPSAMLAHCQQHLAEDFHGCVGLAAPLDGNEGDAARLANIRAMLPMAMSDTRWYTHADARIRAIVAEVPYAADFDLASLATPGMTLGVVQLGQDAWLSPPFHSGALLKACRACEVVADLPDAGHGSLMSPQPVGLAGPVVRLLADPPGFDRSTVPAVHARIAAFFTRHLLP